MTTHHKIEASFSVLAMSIASSAAISLGLSPDPTTGKSEKNPELSRFNIDLLLILKEKTKNNLNPDEEKLLTKLISDLQIHFIR